MKRTIAMIVMAMFVLTNTGASYALRTEATPEASGKAAGLTGDLRTAAQAKAGGEVSESGLNPDFAIGIMLGPQNPMKIPQFS